jgi:hypothetical protein
MKEKRVSSARRNKRKFNNGIFSVPAFSCFLCQQMQVEWESQPLVGQSTPDISVYTLPIVLSSDDFAFAASSFAVFAMTLRLLRLLERT